MSSITRFVLPVLFIAGVFILPVAGCSQGISSVNLEYNFNSGAQGWAGDFADLPVDYEQEGYQIEFDYADSPLDDGKALMLSGMNRSDDLFMFVKKELTAGDGLSPNTTYLVKFKVAFATSAPAGAVGIGGAPGEAVVVKVGAVQSEPLPVEENGYYRLNFNKGEQNNDGVSAVRIGDVSKEISDDFDTYELKTLDNLDAPLEVTTDEDGNLWIFVGTDSGYEGLTTLYYTDIQVTLDVK
jgi:hypothetical protein